MRKGFPKEVNELIEQIIKEIDLPDDFKVNKEIENKLYLLYAKGVGYGASAIVGGHYDL